MLGLCGIESPILGERTFWGVISNLLFLNGISPQYNNNIVPGGWYIGTLMIFYLLSPFLVKLFDKVTGWKRRCVPLVVFMISLLFQIMLIKVGTNINLFGNNSFFYFSWVNMLPSYLIGMCLAYEEIEAVQKNRLLKWISVLFMVIICIVFFFEWPIVYMILPTIFSVCAMKFLVLLETNIMKVPEVKRSLIEKLGEMSYYAYILHIVFAVYMQGVIGKLLKYIVGNYSQFLAFLVCAPIVIFFTYIVSNMYGNKYSSLIKHLKGRA